MPASTNKRIYYASHQVGFRRFGAGGAFTAARGVQSVGMSTNFNLDQVFQLGESSIYENIEEIPDVEITMSKVLDGYPLLYHLATLNATAPTLTGRSNDKVSIALSVFDSALDYATGTPLNVVQCDQQYINSVSYSFGNDGSFTEDASFVGNDKVWLNDSRVVNTNAPTPSFDGAFSGTSTPTGLGGVNRRENLLFEYDPANGLDVNGVVADSDCTIVPTEIYGISTTGTNEKSNTIDYDTHFASISVSVDLQRESINELGRKAPYHRSVSLPIEVTSEFEVTATEGDNISAMEEGILTTGTGQCAQLGNLTNQTIRIATCEGTRIYLGIKNKLSSVNYSGGDTGGGNVSVTYSYTTYNDFTVMHINDPNTNFLWSARNTYLRDV